MNWLWLSGCAVIVAVTALYIRARRQKNRDLERLRHVPLSYDDDGY